jgi:hypothetical protein
MPVGVGELAESVLVAFTSAQQRMGGHAVILAEDG